MPTLKESNKNIDIEKQINTIVNSELPEAELTDLGYSKSEINNFKTAYANSLRDEYNKSGSISNAINSVNSSDYTVYTSSSDISKPQSASLRDYGILGVPHQFLPETDNRINNGDWRGREYKETILDRAPIVFFVPGKPKFMEVAGVADDVAGAAFQKLLNLDSVEEQNEMLEAAMERNKSEMYYYSFENDFETFCDYVNTLVQYTAAKMGLEGYLAYDLRSKRNNEKGFFESLYGDLSGDTDNFAFYVDSSSSYDESGSNVTGDSQLAGSVKSAGQVKREIDFLFGGNSKASTKDLQANVDSYAEEVKSMFGNLEDGTISRIINRMTGTFSTVMTGANILFPEIWQDSSFRKNYSIKIKLMSPYGTPKAIMDNIYIPFFCLLALGVPRQSGKQGYTTPFIIQMFSKGWFNCDLGMVESIDIQKGGSDGNQWSADNLPLEMDITLNVKDLYPTMMMTSKMSSGTAFMNNTGLISYLNVMAGVQINEINIAGNLEAAVSSIIGGALNYPARVYNSVTHKFSNNLRNRLQNTFGSLN